MLVKSDPQIEVLRTLLAEKTEQAAKQEKEIQQFRLDQAVNRKKIVGLTAELAEAEAKLARLSRIKVKEEPRTLEIIEVDDSDEESKNSLDVSVALGELPLRIASPVFLQHEPSDPEEGFSTPTNRKRRRKPQEVAVKEEPQDTVVDVVFKTESATEVRHVILTKNEDGFDIFRVDTFGARAPIAVPKRFYRAFSRKQIKDVFGGCLQVTRHHWTKDPTHRRKENFSSNTQPFATYNRKWSHSLPAHPGAHGIGICNLLDCPTNPEPIPLFVGEGPSEWCLMGLYVYQQCGEVAQQHLDRLPAHVLKAWIDGFVTKRWGDNEIKQKNMELPADRKIIRNYHGVLAALKDGRLVLNFTILECVGYPYDWFEHLEEYEAQMKKKDARGAPKRKRDEVEERDSDCESEESDLGFSRTVLRTSPRKRQK